MRAGDRTIYELKIDAWRPETMPLPRLLAYLHEMAQLLGNGEGVHLVAIKPGSAIPQFAVSQTYVPKVAERLRLARSADAPNELVEPLRRIDKLLRDDNAVGVLRERHGRKVVRLINFPGRERKPAAPLVVAEPGEIDGQIVRIGGRDDTVPVLVEAAHDEFLHCTTSRDLARELGHYLYGPAIRFFGKGRWVKGEEGGAAGWRMDGFVVERFALLDATPIEEALASLAKIEGNAWSAMSDPAAEVQRLRRGRA